MAFDPVTIAAYLFGLAMLYVIVRLLLIPARFTVRVLLHAGAGALGLLAFNWLGQHVAVVDLYVPVNPVTALVAGFLGLPGVLALLALRHWLVAPLWVGTLF